MKWSILLLNFLLCYCLLYMGSNLDSWETRGNAGIGDVVVNNGYQTGDPISRKLYLRKRWPIEDKRTEFSTYIRRLQQTMTDFGALAVLNDGSQPGGLWHVSHEDVLRYAPPSLGGTNTNYGAATAAKQKELNALAQQHMAASGNSVGATDGVSGHTHHHRPGRVDIFALARRTKKPAPTSGILQQNEAVPVSEMPGERNSEKMSHVPGTFDEFDGQTGEFLRSSNAQVSSDISDSHFPISVTHHGTKSQFEQQRISLTAALAAAPTQLQQSFPVLTGMGAS